MVSQKKGGVILSYMSQVVHMLISILYVPFILRVLGQSEYGLYQLATATISNLNILTLGFNSAYIRYYSRYKAKNDREGICRLNGMFLTIFLFFSAICLICGFFLSFNAGMVFGSKLTDGELNRAKILMLLLTFSTAVSFISSVFQSQISAQNRFIWLKLVDFFSYILNPLIVVPLLLTGYGSIGIVAVSTGITCLVCMADFLYAYKKLGVRFHFRQFDFGLFREMSGFTFYVFINIIVEQLNWSIDKFLLGRMRGTATVAVYGVASQLVSIYRSFCGTIKGVFIPQINDMIVSKVSMKTVSELFTKLGRIIFIVCYLIVSGFFLFGREFIWYWAGDGYGNAYVTGLILMVPLMVPMIQGPGLEIQRAMNLHKARSLVYCVIAVLNMIFSIFLIRDYGEIGAAIGTGIALVLGNILFMNIYYQKRIGLDMVYFWKAIFKFIPSVCLTLCLGLIIKERIYHQTMQSLGVCILLYTIVFGFVFWFFGVNTEEKEMVAAPLEKIIKKKR